MANQSEAPFLKIDQVWSEGKTHDAVIKQEIPSEDEEVIVLQSSKTQDFKNSSKSWMVNQELDYHQKASYLSNGVINYNEQYNGTSNRIKKKKATENMNSLKKLANNQHKCKEFALVKKRMRCKQCRGLVCPECRIRINGTVQTHFFDVGTKEDITFSCKLCHLFFLSDCALQAHHRLHSMEPPFVCPDCGVVYNNIHFLTLHLMTKCFHVYKFIKYQCVHCSSCYNSQEQFNEHIPSHITLIFKCRRCLESFETLDQLHEHAENKHGNDKDRSIDFYKCSMCTNMLMPGYGYGDHIKHHCKKSVSYSFAFLCPCGEQFPSPLAFQNHIKGCDQKGVIPYNWEFLQTKLKSQEGLQINGIRIKTQSSLPISTSIANKPVLCMICGDPIEINRNKDEKSLPGSCEKCYQKLGHHKTIPDVPGVKTIGDNNQLTEKLYINRIFSKSDTVNSENQNVVPHSVNNVVFEANGNSWLPSKAFYQPNITPIYNHRNEYSGNLYYLQVVAPTAEQVVFPQVSEQILEIPAETVSTSNVRLDDDDDVFLINEDRKEPPKEISDADEDTFAITYENIPEDHLGYLKTHEHSYMKEQVYDRHSTSFEKNGSRDDCDDDGIERVLDEQTGLLKLHKVTRSESEKMTDASEVHVNNPTDVSEINVNNQPGFRNADVSSYVNPRDKQMKSETELYFTCPFCTVLFPKHPTAFQRFRLHLECYHRDAAIDITVDHSFVPRSQQKFVSPNFHSEGESDPSDVEDVDLQTRLATEGESGKITEEVDQPNADVVTDQVEISTETGETKSESRINVKRTYLAPKSFQSSKLSELTVSKNLNSSQTQGSKVSAKVPPDGKSEADKSITRTTATSVGNGISTRKSLLAGRSLLKKKSGVVDSGKNHVSESSRKTVSSSLGEWKDAANKREDEGSSKSAKNSHKFGKSKSSNDLVVSKPDKKDLSSDILKTALGQPESNELLLKKISTTQKPSSINKTTEKDSKKDFNEDSENSSHDESSVSSSRKFRKKSSDSGGKENGESKPARTEREVWEEFYESLKYAEMLKKKNAAKAQVLLESGKSPPSLTNVISKRVVKRPKRYVESSDSEESDEVDYDSKDEATTERTSEKGEESPIKIEKFNDRLIGYTSDEVEVEEEKLPSRVKKHFPMGINQMESSPAIVVENSKQVSDNLKEVNSLKPEEKEVISDSSNQKKAERKRGRPRKSDVGVVKERRVSEIDKEISFIEKNFETDDSDSVSTKRKRKLSSKLRYIRNVYMPLERDEFSSGQVISNKTADTDKKFSCAVCKESYQNATEFREHILRHRMDDASHQCMECGECFVVRPSLEKHLHAFHKIKDTDKYIEEHECSSEQLEIPEDTEDIEPLKENQCKVCKDQFDCSGDLNKHFRIHGMAFLKEVKKDTKSY